MRISVSQVVQIVDSTYDKDKLKAFCTDMWAKHKHTTQKVTKTRSTGNQRDNKREGIVGEAELIKELSLDKNNTTVHRDLDGFDIYGRCDAYRERDGIREIVEIKTRVHKLVGYIKSYEYTQIQLYMYIYQINNAVLIEKYQKTSNEYLIEYDQSHIDKIRDCLHSFSHWLSKATSLDIFCKDFRFFVSLSM